ERMLMGVSFRPSCAPKRTRVPRKPWLWRRRPVVEQLEDRTLLSQGAVLVKDINTMGGDFFSSNPNQFVAFQGLTYFVADDGAVGPQIWRTDGTAIGTKRVSDQSPGFFNPQDLTVAGNTLFFEATDPLVNGTQLWKTDGTAAGTVMVKDINPHGYDSNPNQLTNLNGTLFFAATDQVHGTTPWKSDGTEAGTVMVGDVPNPVQLTNVNGMLFFNSNQRLWKSDGTDAGTVQINPTSATLYFPFNLTNVNGTLFFAASDNAGHGDELWKSVGTDAG